MATIPGIIFNIDMSPIDNLIRGEYENMDDAAKKSTINNLLFTKKEGFNTFANVENELVKISNEFYQAKHELVNAYTTRGRIPLEIHINKYIQALTDNKEQILAIYNRYEKQLQEIFQKECAGHEDFFKKKNTLEELLAQKKQRLEEEITKDINKIGSLPRSIEPTHIKQGKYIHHRLDKDRVQTSTFTDINDYIEVLVDHAKRNKSTEFEYDFIDSKAGKYEYNRGKSRKVKLKIEFQETKDGYNYKIKLLDKDGNPRHFSNDKDLLLAYQTLLAHIAARSSCGLDLSNFQERFREQLLHDWVHKHGRSLADVVESDKTQAIHNAIHEIVKNNITKDELFAYCNITLYGKTALEKQIANGGNPLNIVDIFPDIKNLTDKQHQLLQRQIQNNGKKLNSKENGITREEVNSINKLYQQYKATVDEISKINKLYETHLRLKNSGLIDNPSLKNTMRNLANDTKKYQQYCKLAKQYFTIHGLNYKKGSLLFKKSRILHPDNLFSIPIHFNTGAYSNKPDALHSTSDKNKYLPQKIADICNEITSGLSSLDNTIALFRNLTPGKQIVVINHLLKDNSKNDFLVAKLFCELPTGQLTKIYRQNLTQAQRDVIYPYLPYELKIICEPKKLAPLPINGNEYISSILSSTSKAAASSYAKLIALAITKPEELQELGNINEDIRKELENLCNTQQLSYLQIGLLLSSLLQAANLSEDARTNIKDAIIDYLTNGVPADNAAKIITQLDGNAQFLLASLFISKVKDLPEDEKEDAIIDSFVSILNNIRSPDVLERLGAALGSDQLISKVLAHPELNNKHCFKKLFVGIATEQNLASENRQLDAFNKIDLSEKIDDQFKKSIAFGALTSKKQEIICAQTIKNAALAAKYWNKKAKLKPLISVIKNDMDDTLRAIKEYQKDNSATDNKDYSAQLKNYLIYYKKLYKLAMQFKLGNMEIDIKSLTNKQTPFPNIYQAIQKIENIPSGLEVSDYKKAIDELNELDFNPIKLEMDSLYENLQQITKESFLYEMELLNYYCPTMKADVANKLLTTTQKTGNYLEGLEEKIFLHLKESVKTQVFASLSENTQLSIIKNNEASFVKRANYLNNLDSADTTKALLQKVEPLDPNLLANLKPELQKELIKDKKLITDNLYNQLSINHKQHGNKTMLREFHKTRPLADAIIADIGIPKLDKPQVKLKSKEPNPMEQLMKQMGRGSN